MMLGTYAALLSLLDRVARALADKRRRARTLAAVLVGYTTVWTLYAMIAKASQDVHFDMGEGVAWSRELATGNPKHPPASAVIIKLWFAVFPLADWAYYLLGMTVAALGLWIAWMVAARWLDAQKRLAGLALLTLVPFYNFHALKFNANTVLIPLWAATTLFFLRSFETQRMSAAVLAGLAAAAAVLGKYWSVMLLAGLGVTALMDPRRGPYFRSAAPWITMACGALALGPHAVWLAHHDFWPVRYAMGEHAAAGILAIVGSDLRFVLGTLGYMAGPTGLALLATRPSWSGVADALWPTDVGRRLAVTAFWTPLWLPPLIALAVGALIVPLWVMPAFTLLPVVLLASPRISLPHRQTLHLVAIALAFPLLMLLAAPAVALFIHLKGLEHHAAHYRLLANAVEQAWRKTSTQPLRLIGSDTNLVNGVVFYLADHPSTYNITDQAETPWVDQARIARQGLAIVCSMQEPRCLDAAEILAHANLKASRAHIELTRHYLGIAGEPQRYFLIVLPPQSP
jgi:Dolichyl-phosphate-mannose-protein mannosyltransferase